MAISFMKDGVKWMKLVDILLSNYISTTNKYDRLVRNIMKKNIQSDIVIVGGGPAGLMCARTLIAKGFRSLTLIEQSLNYAESIVCGEGVWKAPFDALLPHNKQWVNFEITTADFRSPDGTSVLLKDQGKTMGYIIHRAQMQEDLLAEIAENAAVIRGRKVVYCTPAEERLQSVQLEDGSVLTPQLIIDASGPSSLLGNEYGLATKARELEPAAYALVETNTQDTHSIMLQMSSTLGPGGYFWSFPSSASIANVGAVFGLDCKRPLSIRKAIEQGVAELYPAGKVVSWHGGSIPNYTTRRKLTALGYLQCGDSAELVNSISRSGISESMESGVMAAESALGYVADSTDKERRRTLELYEKRLYKKYGKTQQKVAKVKKSLYTSISDDQFNRAAAEINKIPVEKRTMWDILRITCWRVPRLLIALRHLL